MISGIFLTSRERQTANRLFADIAAAPATRSLFANERLVLSGRPGRKDQGLEVMNPVVSEDGRIVVISSGTIYNRSELAPSLGLPAARESRTGDADLLLKLYTTQGEKLVSPLNGTFACLIYDEHQEKLLLLRDRFGVEPLYYTRQPGYLAFSSSINGILQLTGQEKQLNHEAVAKFLLFNYNPGLDSLISGIQRLPAAHFLRQPFAGESTSHRYWQLDFSPSRGSEEEISHELLGHLRRSVSTCLGESSSAGVFLSGGMDSSTILALSAEKGTSALSTFSYRCKAASFDESQYARAMSEFVRSSHHESEYGSDDVLLMPEVVRAMNEPFCDVGINIATYLLGREASRTDISLLMTGDGGDELFAGHPVYEADKIANYVDGVPGILIQPLLALFKMLPDSDQKKSLPVKLKRFSESLAYPRELLSHRWRIYYDDKDLHELASDNFAGTLNWSNLIADIVSINNEIQGPDLLSRCLYSDYQTAVDFYLRRNDLIRRFGLEVRCPLLDHKLVEFCASMPSSLKIKGWFDTKYIFKKTMEGILPDTIIYRKDKLGHSIPLKNWIREDRQVREMILDHVSEAVIKKRGLFKEKFITGLVNDHLAKRRNNSHRLWTLAVLEMWFQSTLDETGDEG